MRLTKILPSLCKYRHDEAVILGRNINVNQVAIKSSRAYQKSKRIKVIFSKVEAIESQHFQVWELIIDVKNIKSLG